MHHPTKIEIRHAYAFALLSQLAYKDPVTFTNKIKEEAHKRKLDFNFQSVYFLHTKEAQVYVCHHVNDNIFVIFRGTQTIAQLIHLIDNVDTSDSHSNGSKLHTGFWEAFNSIWSGCKVKGGRLCHRGYAPIGKFYSLRMLLGLNKFRETDVWFIGHSLGGALAVIAANDYANSRVQYEKVGGVFTFGCPNVGNVIFGDTFNRKFRCHGLESKAFRYIMYGDYVTAMNIISDAKCGTKRFITSTHNILVDKDTTWQHVWENVNGDWDSHSIQGYINSLTYADNNPHKYKHCRCKV